MDSLVRFFSALAILCFVTLQSFSQGRVFTLDDSLRGQITPERAWWDLQFYHLRVAVDPDKHFLNGSVDIFYRVIDANTKMQIDLQPPLKLERVTQDGADLTFNRRGSNAYFIELKKDQLPGARNSVTVFYSGNPIIAKNPPWEGGFQFTRDQNGNHFAATACQGIGPSAWWPNKDHPYDEPDSALISITVPANLMDVSNGRLRAVAENPDGTKTFNWFVSNPINSYGINANIATYEHFSDTLRGEKGVLDLDFYVLPYNLSKAKEQFKQAKLMLKAFEHWFGPYPFYEDGFKLVEVPYLGMEHQSSVTYGNGYSNGYRGRDLSGTGWGLKWDFIIIHESGHEWFANNITYADVADMWIHESFTNYSECLFIEYYYGKEAGTDYVVGLRRDIQNDIPIIGVYNLDQRGSGDMYNKGGNLLHTLRHSLGDDDKFRQILRGLNETFWHKTVTTQQVESYISQTAGLDFSKVFDQYLRTVKIPRLEFRVKGRTLAYRWANAVEGFDLQLRLADNAKRKVLKPTTEWQTLKTKNSSEVIDKSFLERMYYITVTQVP
jgi:aminopeptidase N